MSEVHRSQAPVPAPAAKEVQTKPKPTLDESLTKVCVRAVKEGLGKKISRCLPATGWFEARKFVGLDGAALIAQIKNINEKNIRFLTPEQIGQLKGKLQGFNVEQAIRNARDQDRQEAIAGLLEANKQKEIVQEALPHLKSDADCQAFSDYMLQMKKPSDRVEFLKGVKGIKNPEEVYKNVLPKIDPRIVCDFFIASAAIKNPKFPEADFDTHRLFDALEQNIEFHAKEQSKDPKKEQYIEQSKAVVQMVVQEFGADDKYSWLRNSLEQEEFLKGRMKRATTQDALTRWGGDLLTDDKALKKSSKRRDWIDAVFTLQLKEKTSRLTPEERMKWKKIEPKLRHLSLLLETPVDTTR